MGKKKTLRYLKRLVKDAIPLRLKYRLKYFFPISITAPEAFSARDLLNKGDIAFDGGANVGYFTVIMSRLVGRRGCVYAFEPNDTCLVRLHKEIKLSGIRNCVVVHGALAETGRRFVTLYLDERLRCNGVASTIVPELGNPTRLGTNNINKIQVLTICLDDYCEMMNIYPNFVKLDIEGAELMALRGFRKALSKFQPHIILEYGSEGKGTSNTSIHFLQDYGYELIDLHTYERITAEDYSQQRLFRNILAIHREKIDFTPYGKMLLKDICVINAKDLNFTDNIGETLKPLMVILGQGRYVASFIFNASENPIVGCAVFADDRALGNCGGYYDELNWVPYVVFEVKRRIGVYFSLKRHSERGTLNFYSVRLQKVVI